MSSDKVIVVSPTSQRTIDRDVERVASAIDYVAQGLGKKISADFETMIMDDVPKLFKNGTVCDHVFGIATPHNSKLINSQFIPDDAVLLCAKCNQSFSLFTADEIKEMMSPPGGRA